MALAMLGGVSFVGWLLLPWRRIEGLRVESAQVVTARGGGGPSRRVVVDFSIDDDLRDVLARYGAGFVTARMFACDDAARETQVVVVQRGGYLVDEGRVRSLPESSGRPRYLAQFEDRLSGMVDHRIISTPALTPGAPLCFTLAGGGMFMGRIRAATIPLAPFLRKSS